jgi:uncharacterized integral membrane protein
MTGQDVPPAARDPLHSYADDLPPVGADGAAPGFRDGIGALTNAPAVAGRTRASARTWVVGVVSVLVLLALIVFIAQNTANARISFLGLSGSLPLAAALLAAALAGAVVTVAVGAMRSRPRRRATRRGH